MYVLITLLKTTHFGLLLVNINTKNIFGQSERSLLQQNSKTTEKALHLLCVCVCVCTVEDVLK